MTGDVSIRFVNADITTYLFLEYMIVIVVRQEKSSEIGKGYPGKTKGPFSGPFNVCNVQFFLIKLTVSEVVPKSCTGID